MYGVKLGNYNVYMCVWNLNMWFWFEISSGRNEPHLGTLQASFWTTGSVVKHHGPSGWALGFLQKFSCSLLFGAEALNSLHTDR